MTANSSVRIQWAPTAAAAMKDSPWQRMEEIAPVSQINNIANSTIPRLTTCVVLCSQSTLRWRVFFCVCCHRWCGAVLLSNWI